MARGFAFKIGIAGFLAAGACVGGVLCWHSRRANRPWHAGQTSGVQNTLTREELRIHVQAVPEQWPVALVHIRPGFEFVRIPTPFFRETAIYRVTGFTTLEQPKLMLVKSHILKTSDGRVVRYHPGFHGQWRHIVRRERLCVTTPGDAADLFRTYALAVDFHMIERFEDMPYSPSVAKLSTDWRRNFQHLVLPLAFQARGRRFESTFHALRTGRDWVTDIVRGTARVDRSGNIQVQWHEILARAVLPDLGMELSLSEMDRLDALTRLSQEVRPGKE